MGSKPCLVLPACSIKGGLVVSGRNRRNMGPRGKGVEPGNTALGVPPEFGCIASLAVDTYRRLVIKGFPGPQQDLGRGVVSRSNLVVTMSPKCPNLRAR